MKIYRKNTQQTDKTYDDIQDKNQQTDMKIYRDKNQKINMKIYRTKTKRDRQTCVGRYIH